MALKFNPDKVCIPRYKNVFALPPRALVFTNSELRTAWCKRKWHSRYILGIQDDIPISSPMNFGRVFHQMIETIHRAWMAGIGFNFDEQQHELQSQGMAMLFMEYAGYDEEIREICSRALKAIKGYLHKWCRFDTKTSSWYLRSPWKIVGVEEEFCMPIYTEKMKHYKSLVRLYYNEKEKSWKQYHPGIDWVLQKMPFEVMDVVLPWYQVCKLDFVLYNEEDNKYYVGEMKTSASPLRYAHNLQLDPQIRSYIAALEYAISKGWAEGKGLPKAKVGGYFYDIAYSGKHMSPNILKSGGLSKSKNARVFSWEYREQIKKLNLDEADYAEHISYIEENIDSVLYYQSIGKITPGQQVEHNLEIYTKCRELSVMRRKASDLSAYSLSLNYPKTTLCRTGQGCAYAGYCSSGIGNAQENTQLLSWKEKP